MKLTAENLDASPNWEVQPHGDSSIIWKAWQLVRDPLFTLTKFNDTGCFYVAYGNEVIWMIHFTGTKLVLDDNININELPLLEYFSWLRCTSLLKEIAYEQI